MCSPAVWAFPVLIALNVSCVRVFVFPDCPYWDVRPDLRVLMIINFSPLSDQGSILSLHPSTSSLRCPSLKACCLCVRAAFRLFPGPCDGNVFEIQQHNLDPKAARCHVFHLLETLTVKCWLTKRASEDVL